jgi:RNA polymerase sigma-70 factor (ECF subfamily)
MMPSIKQLVALRPFIRKTLRQCGVSKADLPDLYQDVISAAHFAIEAKAFVPDPKRDPGDSLRAWLYGICWRQASHYRHKAFRRREIPRGLCLRVSSVDPRPWIEVRSDLFVIRHLGRNDREMLLSRADGDSITKIAEERKVNKVLVSRRIRRSRFIMSSIIKKMGVFR